MVMAGKVEELPGFIIYSNGSVRRPSGKMVKLDSYAGRGYKVFKGADRRNYYVHIVVCTAFKGPRPKEGMIVRHLDGNHLNNSAENLEWGTDLENGQDTVKHGKSTKGERNARAKLSEVQVTSIRTQSAQGSSGVSLAKKYGVSPATVSLIINRKNWRL